MVMFNTLVRGTWKNKTTPTINSKYKGDYQNPSGNTYSVFQAHKRDSSIDPSQHYDYHRAIDYQNKIVFGYNLVLLRDFYNYARMPFKQSDYVTYYGHNNNLKLSLTVPRDNADKAFSKYASKFSNRYGIFYAYTNTSGTKLSDLIWTGISVANKDSIPTLKQFDTSTMLNTAGNIMTTSFQFLSDSEDKYIRIYSNRIRDITGGVTYWFDSEDHNAILNYIYIVSQAPGGNGGRSRYNWFWRGGSGGGAGGWSLDLVGIPKNSYIEVLIPAAPQKTSERVYDKRRAPSVKIWRSTSLIREITGGEYGQTPPRDTTVPGGEGGYVVKPYDRGLSESPVIKNIANASGGDGARNRYKDENGNLIVSGASQNIAINGKRNALVWLPYTQIDTIDTDGFIKIPSIAGVESWWDAPSDASDLPGPGGSSQLGRGGNIHPLQDGQSGQGPGAGGAGGAKALAHEYNGGAGGSAAVFIGF